VLIAEDDGASRLVLRRFLEREGYPVLAVADGASAWRELQTPDPPRLAILDWMLPGLDGVEVCRRLRASGRRAYTYVMMLTGRDRHADKLEGFEAGADDYLIKPFDRDEMLARLAVGRRFLELHGELAAANARLRVEAAHDTLTGLLNRGAAAEALVRELARSRRGGGTLAIVLIDLDRFKSINDGFGHAAGDAVLAESAARLRAGVREGDLVARWGGEELLAVLLDSDAVGALAVAERLRVALASQPVATPAGPVPISASFGIATTAEGHEANALLRCADARLYLAKQRGRDRVEGPSPTEPGRLALATILAAQR
jgi:diguanylate cyclase (GGDEF)-like protein